jgi:enamine deaminase RidA (YjgF/YER057c/UK114 family)
VFVSGQLPSNYRSALAPEARPRPASPYRDSWLELESRYILGNLARTLDAAGCDLRKDVLRIQWWLGSDHPTYEEFENGINWTRLPDLSPIHDVRAQHIDEPQPASTGIGVRQLTVPAARMGVSLIAVPPVEGIERTGVVPPPELESLPDTPAVRAGDWIWTVGVLASDWRGDFMSERNLGEPSFVAPEARVNPYVWFGSPIEAQTEYVLDQIERLADAAGTSLDRAVRAEVFIGHPNDLYGLERVWSRRFPSNPPARVVVPYSGLAGKGIRVEISMLFLAGDAEIEKTTIETSDAPEPFGHEPQAVRAGELLFLSGQLPVDSLGEVPSNLKVDESFPYWVHPPRRQAEYVVANIAAICEAAGSTIDNVCWRNGFYDDLCVLPETMDVWRSSLRGDPPAATDIGLGRGWPLLVPGAHALLDVIAYVPAGAA